MTAHLSGRDRERRDMSAPRYDHALIDSSGALTYDARLTGSLRRNQEGRHRHRSARWREDG